jgi:hypothetical protein
MFFYRQFWKTLAQTAKKLNLQLIEIIYIAVIQAFTPPPPSSKKANQEYLIVCSFVRKTTGMVKQFEQSLPCS